MKNNNNLLYNEKPSSVPNIGEDIDGAHRHSFNTYETPEELRKKAAKKQSVKDLKTLKESTEKTLNQIMSEVIPDMTSAKVLLQSYEFKKAVLSCELLTNFKGDSMELLRAFVLSTTNVDERIILRRKYNSLVNLRHKLDWRSRTVSGIEFYKNYFQKKTKNQFKEINGHSVNWKTTSTQFDKAFLASKVKAVQFGNSLTENERIYVSENLIDSIKILEKYFKFDFKTIGFSYGARGKAGSIAHYQDSAKVLAFNRGWDGALVHELGHAIDYSLSLVSKKIPYSLLKKYEDRLRAAKIPAFMMSYYMDPKEVFARLFEGYVKKTIPESTSFMIFLSNSSTIPDMDSEAMDYMTQTLKPILVSQSEK